MTDLMRLEPPIVFDLKGNPGAVEFNHAQEVLDWATQEQSRWNRVLRQSSQNGVFFDEPKERQFQSLTQLVNYIRKFISQNNQDLLDNFRSQIADHLQKYATNQIIHSDSKIGRLVLSNENNNIAASIFSFLCSQNKSLRSTDQFDILALLEAWSKHRDTQALNQATLESLDIAAKAAGERLATTTEKQTKLIDEHLDLIVEGRAKLKETDAKIAAALEENEKTSAGFFTASKEYFEKLMKMHSERIEEIEKYYKEHLAVSEVFRFWAEKEKTHFNSSLLWGLAFVFIMIMASFGLFKYGVEHIKSATSGEIVNYQYLALVTVPMIFVAWILRVCSRMFSLNSGLRWDARERIAMAKTFLSLTRQSEKLNDNERAEVIRSLFRPAAVVGSDDAPLSVVDDLLKKTQSR